MYYPDIIHHGAIDTVTGSSHQLCMDAFSNLLIDCGSVQERTGQAGASSFTFVPESISALLITHVHNDHVGRIPELLASGYTGPILCSEPSAHLLPLVMEDILKNQLAHDPLLAGQTLKDINKRIIALPFDNWFSLVDNEALRCKVRLQRAGHILGSAYVECDLYYPLEERSVRVVFSGDLGASETPFLPAPKPPERADILILESTYGDRLHEDRGIRQQTLEQIIDKALEDQGTVLIPAFSIGRTQELLYELEDILRRKALLATSTESVGDAAPADWSRLPVILDSPLAKRFTGVYQSFEDYWDDDARERIDEGRAPLGFAQLVTVDTHEEHIRTVNYLASTARPAIVIAGNGMCAGGRIVNYLKAMLGDSRHNVVFVGYQGKETPGAAIQAHGPLGGYVELDRERYDIRAGVHTVKGYSAHADQAGLVAFVTGMSEWPGQIRLVHGEAGAKKALGSVLARKYMLEKRIVDLIIP
ncbi:MBL fold metallo-hydrolase RNA specificity domain-containing protein [Pseudomonas cannabina]|uniref:Metallo-beta-lactamase protein n=3 Tax=Pseudomonas syringae group TaxID=136849 RepID=A0A3M3RMN6_PSECA|nr:MULTISPECIES: MBL fold metallo-hydrolase [Pseudomonas syringae group]KPB74570.1 Metallo-beta-lactamase family protein [Pseudomonas syringae pv. maculicola]KPW24106.1 Metallo-beta-lactamase family protein, RNA-specific [Pseudomonas cannabina pv. alisalensis]MBM0139865.1 MBL fold metallo-hydrolase [Pseudomonas cannabina pv. alisalensis]QHE98420.1 MBL fold metallo-hydrolase [Pseudomonas syringae pv. maculicola str. ES4326]QQN23313.1 MBL fold metallo-hydrolase [Pseudomonas cannabina pv. alisale